MLRYNLIEGEMCPAEDGLYCLYSDVISVDNVAANTLLAQLDGIREQVSEWQTT
jgi:hypothetical protein